MADCPSCGAALEPDWQFCQACGRAVAEAPGEPVEGGSSQHRLLRGPARWVLLAATVVLLLAGGGLAIAEEVETHRNLSDTREDLTTTRSRLASTSALLKRARADVKRRTSERDTARNTLASARQQLTGVRQSLNDSERRVDVQAGQIQTLRTCLDGIIDALVYSAEGNVDAAIGALDAVENACIEAESLL